MASLWRAPSHAALPAPCLSAGRQFWLHSAECRRLLLLLTFYYTTTRRVCCYGADRGVWGPRPGRRHGRFGVTS